MGPLMGAVAGPAAGALIGAAGSLFSGKQSADFAERSYKHRYQWQVKDLVKAGLNPMLAVNQGAPNVPQPSFQNIGEGAVKGFSAAQQARLLAEQLRTQEATTQRTQNEAEAIEIDNLIKRYDPLYRDAVDADPARGGSGINATAAKKWELEFAGKQAIIDNAKADLQTKGLQQRLMNQTYDWNRDIQPLLKQEQEYVNKARAANLPELEAAADFWSNIGATGKALEMLLDIIPGGEAIARVLTRRKVMIGRETSTTGPKGTTWKQETFDYGR